MAQFEYQVVPAPRRGEKGKGLRTTEARFAHALTQVMNRMARDGWEYLRTDTLPVEERSGLTGRTTTYQHLLVFRRDPATPATAAATAAAAPTLLPPPVADPAPATDPVDLSDEPLDIAARRAAMIARPEFGNAPPVSVAAETGLANRLGPAADDRHGTGGKDHAAG